MAHREQPAPRWQLINRLGDMLVAQAMAPEAPQALVAPVGGDGIGGGLGRQGRVEGDIEAGPLLQVRLLGRQPAHHPKGRAIVQGSHRHHIP